MRILHSKSSRVEYTTIFQARDDGDRTNPNDSDDPYRPKWIEIENSPPETDTQKSVPNKENPAYVGPGEFTTTSNAYNALNPWKKEWAKSAEPERNRIEPYSTRREFRVEEEGLWRQGKIKTVPCGVLANRKRCGRYNSRLICLGN